MSITRRALHLHSNWGSNKNCVLYGSVAPRGEARRGEAQRSLSPEYWAVPSWRFIVVLRPRLRSSACQVARALCWKFNFVFLLSLTVDTSYVMIPFSLYIFSATKIWTRKFLNRYLHLYLFGNSFFFLQEIAKDIVMYLCEWFIAT